MRIAVAHCEANAAEVEFAATPDTVKKMKGLGVDVAVSRAPESSPASPTPSSPPRVQPWPTVS